MALKVACIVLLAVVALASCPSTQSTRLLRAAGSAGSRPPANLWQLISNSSSSADLTTLKLLVQSADLVEQLNSSVVAATTMFLPNNAAWSDYLVETGRNLTQLMQQPSLPAQLLYHLRTGSRVTIDNIQPGVPIVMANGVNVTGDLSYDDIVELRDAAGRTSEIVSQALSAGPNATAYIVSRVLVPQRPQTLEQALLGNTQLSSFLTVMYVGGFNATLRSTNTSMTFFVPTNDAFIGALATLNLTFSALLENRTLVTSIVSAHILPTVERWEALLAYSGVKYFFTCNTCATFYTEETDSGQLEMMGVGSIVASEAMIEDDNLIAGQVSLVHTIDSVLLPLARWGSKCFSRCQSPGDIPPPQRRAMIAH